jgi:hypothetical protein
VSYFQVLQNILILIEMVLNKSFMFKYKTNPNIMFNAHPFWEIRILAQRDSHKFVFIKIEYDKTVKCLPVSFYVLI